MKVLMINGSAHENGCTATALKEMARVLRGEGIESEIVCLGRRSRARLHRLRRVLEAEWPLRSRRRYG